MAKKTPLLITELFINKGIPPVDKIVLLYFSNWDAPVMGRRAKPKAKGDPDRYLIPGVYSMESVIQKVEGDCIGYAEVPLNV